MSGQQPGCYRAERLKVSAAGVQLWGVRAPDGEWLLSMGQPEWHLSETTALRIADERNQAKGLLPAGDARP
ncbi:hypothetical protein [Kitasatospora fiedleri]|uniref:hypothetical protein n=1 Tax=Kitasatospora fiedleri TaxID=2991545 RepID=UPI002499E237|nr:hypothetical protein [Kitasatospora fiedleri]